MSDPRDPDDLIPGKEPDLGMEVEEFELALEKQRVHGRTALWADVWYRLRHNKMAMVGLAIIILLVLVAIFAPLLAPYDPNDQMEIRTPGGVKQPPTWKHWLGTDGLGRDILSRLIYGSRVSVEVGIVAVLISLVIGLFFGALAGYFGGWGDSVIMRTADIFFAFPTVLGAIAIMTVLGPGLINVFIAIGVLGWATIARIFRGSILSVKENEYVEAARAMGASNTRIIWKHIMPNAIQPIIVYATMGVGGAILAEAWLAFLGLGQQLPTPSWGNMLAEYLPFYTTDPWMMFIPGIAIVVSVLAFILLGDGLRDALDPRLKGSV
ncbi:MAG: ABC transporter permease [Actinomycetota bacterium]|nr:ABC transporter permease [Actinomycetota bacterium]